MESLTPVVNYILEGKFPKEFTTGQRRKLIKQASTFIWLEGSLYQKGKDLVCRRVPSTNEIPKILKGLHEEACGGHFSHELTLKKVLLAGYVWPSMHADVQHWCRSYHNCQVNGNKKLLYGPRQAVIANGPFEKWGIDAMGPLPRTANGKLYILVAIDYMTRWVEAQSIAKVNEKTVINFVYTHICCRFGTPLEIVSDNGPGFRRGLLTEVCEELKISHRHSTPYYPQSNGLVEKANGIIAGIIRKMVESKPKRWDNFLDGAIWAYRTTYRDATQFTPFHLVYEQEALQPIVLNIPTIKLTGRQEQNNDEAWIDRLLSLVELEWKREAAYHCYEKKALQLKDKLNEGLKDKEIKEKSLVLRYNNALDNRFDAMFERRWEGPFIVKKAFTGGYYQLMDLNGKEHPRKVNGYRLKPYLSRILPAVFETKQVSKKTKKVCCHCCSDTHQVKSCAFQHVLKEVAKNQKENLSSPTSCPESSFQYDRVDEIEEQSTNPCSHASRAATQSRSKRSEFSLFYSKYFMLLRSGKQVNNRNQTSTDLGSNISTEASVNQKINTPLKTIVEDNYSDSSSKLSYFEMASSSTKVNFDLGTGHEGESSDKAPNHQLLFLKFQFENDLGAKIFKDVMERYCVKVEDRWGDLRDMVLVIYSGDRYFDDQGFMYIVVLNPSIIDKWGWTGTKEKVDVEPEEAPPTLNKSNLKLQRDMTRVNTDNIFLGLYKYDGGEHTTYYRCEERLLRELTNWRRCKNRAHYD
ncbi:hypothetical protein L7F22_040609 [Adiantum nelumboides]|nr:hypothetical protein [Adiantum nelumboides]